MMRAKKQGQREGGDASIRNVGNPLEKPLNGNSEMKASDAGIEIKFYADRVYKNQGNELQEMFKKARVQSALEKQGYPDDEIQKVLKVLGQD